MSATEGPASLEEREGPPGDLRRLVEARVGASTFRLSHRWTPASSAIWRVDGPQGTQALKVHAGAEGYRRERAAYEDWLSRRGAPPAPRLMAAFDGPAPALLLSWVDGATLLDSPGMSVDQELGVYRAAGAAVRALHALPVDATAGAGLGDLVRAKIRRRVELLRGVISPDVGAWALRVADADRPWADLRIGPCHRDCSPRNWVVGPPAGPGVTLIDFEHAEVDFLATDAMKLWDGPFIGRPDRRDAFYAGYGLPPAHAAREARVLAPAHGLSIVDWSRRNGDAAYEAHGLAFLTRAARGDDWADDRP